MIWQEFKELVTHFLPFIDGVALVYVLNLIKKHLGIEDRYAWIVTILASVVMAFFTLVAKDQLAPETLTLTNFAETVIAVFTAATAWYFKIAKKN